MQHEQLKIEIGGSEIDTLYADLVSLEVELDEELAGMFCLNIALFLDADGTWTYLDDERLTIWSEVAVTAGLESDTRELISGYITHVRPVFGAGLDQCHLEIWGMDASVLMDREDKRQDWPNRSDSDIAADIFSSYGLIPQVEETGIIHDSAVSTIIQRETDIQFLKRLAVRNGFDCFVEGGIGYFRSPQLRGMSQPVLSVQFGDTTNVNRFQLDVNALATKAVGMSQMDRGSRQILDAASESSAQQALGAEGSNAYLGGGVTRGLSYVAGAVTTGVAEMSTLCEGLFNRGEWFVTGEGEVAANQYDAVLKPRALVTIKGIGETHSGIYYVTHVNHIFTADGYVQRFRVKRNGLMPTGAEDFSDADGLLGGLI